MARARRTSVTITNVHPEPRSCEVCPSQIVNGQGAYVAASGKATHTACPPHSNL